MRLRATRAALPLGLLVLSMGLVSCVTMTRNAVFVKADAGADARNYDQAARILDGPDSKTFYTDKDQVLRNLDAGMLFHFAGETEESLKRLEAADRLIELNFTKSLSNAAASFVLNDYQLEYFGEAYEDLYVNVFKALDYLRTGQVDDAYVEIRRVDTKLNLLEDKYGRLADSMNSSPTAKGTVKAGRSQFHNSALARYLSFLIYRAIGKPDDAELDLKKLREAFASQPTLYNFPLPPLSPAAEDGEKAKLTVMAFTGRSPLKRANNLRINTLQNLIVISTQKEDSSGHLTFTNLAPLPFPGVEGGYNFKAELPEMVLRPSKVARVSVLVDGNPAGDLALLEKLDSIALETFQFTQTPIFFKTIVRTVTKGILTQKAKEQANRSASQAGELGMVLAFAGGIAADLAVDYSEQADLRNARYFPGQAYIGEFEVPPGEHEVTFEYYGAKGELLYREMKPKASSEPGALNFIDAYDLQ